MKLLRQFCFVLALGLLGDLIKKMLNLPLPGSVIGMILLFLLLYFKVVKVENLKEISNFLLDHLAFFFIPAGVGLMAYIGILKDNWLEIGGISLITTVLVFLVTGSTIQFLRKRWIK
ncbi:MAG: CidA/LrgA family protein [Clostridiales bacterium]|nr:CidA/LrgA family protein [Clostridiales bacterium]